MRQLSITTPKKIQGILCESYLDESGIFHIRSKGKLITSSELEFDLKQIQDHLSKYSIKPPVLFDATNLPPLDKKIRKRFEQILNEMFSALGVVSESKIGLMIANIFIALSKTEVPTKIFSHTMSAEVWLRNYRGH